MTSIVSLIDRGHYREIAPNGNKRKVKRIHLIPSKRQSQFRSPRRNINNELFIISTAIGRQINPTRGYEIYRALRHWQHPFLRVIPERPNNPDECSFKQTAGPHYLWPLDGCIKNNDVAPHSAGTRINEAIKLISLPRYIFILLSRAIKTCRNYDPARANTRKRDYPPFIDAGASAPASRTRGGELRFSRDTVVSSLRLYTSWNSRFPSIDDH